MSADVERSPKPTRGWPGALAIGGWSFVVLVLISAGMADVPDRTVPVDRVRDFYQGHPGVIVVAQVLSLAATATFLAFSLALAYHLGSSGAVRNAGLGVTATSAFTVAPVLALAAGADTMGDDTVRLWLALGDATDVLLFVAIAAFSVTTARVVAQPSWRAALLVCAVASAARAALLALGLTPLGLVAPLVFLALVAALATAGRTASAA